MPADRLYYPAFIDIKDTKCVVVGGGNVAARKVGDLLRAGADVRVISPKLTSTLEKKKEKGLIRHTARAFRATDLHGAFIVIAATDDAELNAKVASNAGGALINVVDRPDLCTFIVPATVRRGPLNIAVSTSGASPALARVIRKELQDMFGPEVGKYLERLCRERQHAMKEIADPKARARFLRSLGSESKLKKLMSSKRGER